MDENEQENIDSTNDTEQTENQEETSEETSEETQEETKEEVDVEVLKKENATLKAQKDHWKKKAEAPKETKADTSGGGLTAKDVLALSAEGVTNEEDVDFAEKWAKFNNKSVSATLKDPIFKNIMEQRKEERQTAQVTQTKGGARGMSKVTGEDLLRKAEKGEFPEKEEDIEKMLDAKYEARRKSLKRD